MDSSLGIPIYCKLVIILTLLLAPEFHCNIDFETQRKNHELKTLTITKYKRLAALSDKKIFNKQMLEPMMIERVVDTVGNREAQQHIKAWMGEKLRWTIEDDSFSDSTPYGTKKFNNIVATLDPSAHRFLVLACHFDSKYYKDFEFIGATDSAVPCAMLLDLARTLNYSLHNGKGSAAEHVSLQFIFFDGEEAFEHWTATDSIYGARNLALRWQDEPHPHDPESKILDGIDALILLDLIGASNPTFHNMFDETSNLFKRLASIESKLHKAGVLENHPAPIQYFPSSPYYGRIEDDHIPFLEKGVPILHLICSPFPTVWHTAGDNADALDYPTIDNLNKIMRIFVSEYLHLKM